MIYWYIIYQIYYSNSFSFYVTSQQKSYLRLYISLSLDQYIFRYSYDVAPTWYKLSTHHTTQHKWHADILIAVVRRPSSIVQLQLIFLFVITYSTVFPHVFQIRTFLFFGKTHTQTNKQTNYYIILSKSQEFRAVIKLYSCNMSKKKKKKSCQIVCMWRVLDDTAKHLQSDILSQFTEQHNRRRLYQ